MLTEEIDVGSLISKIEHHPLFEKSKSSAINLVIGQMEDLNSLQRKALREKVIDIFLARSIQRLSRGRPARSPVLDLRFRQFTPKGHEED
ncbi:MAG: hypothetical protein AAB660_02210 [Patescibacteria group bacterium]